MAESKDDDSDDGLSGAADFVQIYMIQCDIIAGHDLVKADVLGKSDPYVKVSAFSRTYTTCTIMKTLNPKWNEHVEMTFFNDPKKLKFEVYDWDKGSKDDPIGNCEFLLHDDFYSPSNSGFHGRLKLENVKKGELEIKVVARKLVPSELQNKVTTLQDSVERNGQRMEVLMDEITDFGQKNTALKAQIDGLQSDAADLNAAAPSRRDELQKLKQQEDSMDSEEKEVNLEVETLNETLSEVEEELKEIKKQIADVQVEEDKKHNRIERKRERMEDERRKRDYKAKVAAEAKENTDNKSLLNSNATKKAPAGQSKACSCCVVL